jgi:hypothetical protein
MPVTQPGWRCGAVGQASAAAMAASKAATLSAPGGIPTLRTSQSSSSAPTWDQSPGSQVKLLRLGPKQQGIVSPMAWCRPEARRLTRHVRVALGGRLAARRHAGVPAAALGLTQLATCACLVRDSHASCCCWTSAVRALQIRQNAAPEGASVTPARLRDSRRPCRERSCPTNCPTRQELTCGNA